MIHVSSSERWALMDELQEFDRYLAHLSEGLGHADRHAGLRGYLPREWADGATRQGRCARGIAVCNQAADSAAANRALDGSGCAPALCAGRCRLRRGAKERTPGCVRALPACGCAQRTGTTCARNCANPSGCSSNGPRVTQSRWSTGCLRCPGTHPWRAWCLKPRCVGVSSATTRTSSRISAWATTRAGAGAAFIITPA